MLLNSPEWFEVRPGSCGRACPGRKVAIVDNDGNLLPPGAEGQIAGETDVTALVRLTQKQGGVLGSATARTMTITAPEFVTLTPITPWA